MSILDQADRLRKEMLEEPEKFPGAVYSYIPLQHHCREGIAVRGKDGLLRDTFWEFTGGDYQPGPGELPTAKFLFHMDDFRVEKYEYTWEKFNPKDRRIITSQHGLQKLFLVRNGADFDLDTMISNAEKKVEERERQLASAQGALNYAKDRLEEIKSQKP